MNIDELKKSIEKKGLEQIQSLYKSKSIDKNSVPQALNAIANGDITQNHLTSIMQNGIDEFKKETGRNMTYGEMRELYG